VPVPVVAVVIFARLTSFATASVLRDDHAAVDPRRDARSEERRVGKEV